MIRLALAGLALVLLCVGGAAFWQALSHRKPEFQERQSMVAFARADWYDATGQQFLRRGWAFQAGGWIVLLLLLLFG